MKEPIEQDRTGLDYKSQEPDLQTLIAEVARQMGWIGPMSRPDRFTLDRALANARGVIAKRGG